jgi:phosphomannomutase/phosphoglucomutase
MSKPAAHIFRAYDIRGEAEPYLTDLFCTQLARCLAAHLKAQGRDSIVLARDGRLSSPRIHSALCAGLLGNGITVFDLGLVPTPIAQFARYHLKVESSAVITGSHNPAADNGIKLVLAGKTLSADAIQVLYQDMLLLGEEVDVESSSSAAALHHSIDIWSDYRDYIKADVNLAAPLKVVVDSANGATGPFAAALFRELGCEVFAMFDEVDGRFPNHAPDPSIAENLQALHQAVCLREADIGIGLDGDGDRVAVVSRGGKFPSADQLLMILAEPLLKERSGAVVFDIKSSRAVADIVMASGGTPVLSRSGHSYMKTAMAENNALLGAELSGHVFYGDRWFGFDDGLYAGARLLEILSLSGKNLDQLVDALPKYESTPEILVAVPEDQKFGLVDKVQKLALASAAADCTINTLDGLRLDFENGWGLVRASNTSAALTLRFEASNKQSLVAIQTHFRDLLKSALPSLALPF